MLLLFLREVCCWPTPVAMLGELASLWYFSQTENVVLSLLSTLGIAFRYYKPFQVLLTDGHCIVCYTQKVSIYECLRLCM